MFSKHKLFLNKMTKLLKIDVMNLMMKTEIQNSKSEIIMSVDHIFTVLNSFMKIHQFMQVNKDDISPFFPPYNKHFRFSNSYLTKNN